mmetsp:Transcript_333/g.778  ORF Transcript_333/g.778 Transcript_333/m.778 type:complete len:201 (+) Transcript_333:1933-2535(+)
MKLQIIRSQARLPTLLSINQNNHIRHLEPHIFQRLDSLHHRGPTRHQILHNQTRLTLLERPFYRLLRPIILHFLSSHQHRSTVIQRHARGNGQRRVWHSTHDVKRGSSQLCPHRLTHSEHNLRIRYNNSKINVYWGDQPTLELKFTKFDSLNLMQLQHQFLIILIGHLIHLWSHSSDRSTSVFTDISLYGWRAELNPRCS